MIFILGGNGFVGSALKRYAESRGYDHVALSRQNYHDYVGSECDIFINANGNSRKFLAVDRPGQEFELSVNSVLNSLVDFKFKKYVLISTIDVYDDVSNPQSNREDAVVDVNKLSNYGFHKHIAETVVKRYAKDWLIARFGGFVGKGLKKNSIFDILNKKPLWVDLRSRYQYIDVDAAAGIVFKVIQLEKGCDTVNICGNNTISLEEVGDMLARKAEIMYAVANPRLECYNVNINKLKTITAVPETYSAVYEFVNSYRGSERT